MFGHCKDCRKPIRTDLGKRCWTCTAAYIQKQKGLAK